MQYYKIKTSLQMKKNKHKYSDIPYHLRGSCNHCELGYCSLVQFGLLIIFVTHSVFTEVTVVLLDMLHHARYADHVGHCLLTMFAHSICLVGYSLTTFIFSLLEAKCCQISNLNDKRASSIFMFSVAVAILLF